MDRRRIGMALAGVFGVVAIGALIAAMNALRDDLPVSVVDAVEIEGVVRLDALPRTHDNSVEYVHEPLPPMGGIHADSWMNCGVYNEELPVANALHSLEHGAIWITYQPGLDEAQLLQLRDLTRETDHRLLSPYDDLASPIVLTAWGRQLGLESVDDPRLGEFIELYEGGPNAPEPGVTCANGVGSPIN